MDWSTPLPAAVTALKRTVCPASSRTVRAASATSKAHGLCMSLTSTPMVPLSRVARERAARFSSIAHLLNNLEHPLAAFVTDAR